MRDLAQAIRRIARTPAEKEKGKHEDYLEGNGCTTVTKLIALLLAETGVNRRGKQNN